MTNSHLLRLLACLSLLSFASSLQPVTAATVPESLNAFLDNHCIDCHSGAGSEAGLDLAELSTDLTSASALNRWVRIYDRVHSGEMPPPDASEISIDQREAFLAGSKDWLAGHQRREWAELGRVRGRRLTNLQLERTLHDVLGIDIPLASRMPEEMKSSGFSTVAAGQPMSHFQLQEHLKIVDIALDEAFRRALESEEPFRKEFDAQGLSRTNPRRRTREPEVIGNLAVTWSSRLIFYGRIPATTARDSGWYRFTLRAKALKSPKEHGVWCTVRTGKCVSSAPLLSWVGAFEATDEIQEWTFETWLPSGEMLEVRPGDDTLKMGRFEGGQVGTGEGEPQDVPGVGIESLIMERFHRGPAADEIRSILWDALPVKNFGRNAKQIEVDTRTPLQDLERLMLRFAQRAYRRQVELSDVAPYITFASESLENGQPFLEALRIGYRALLCSPRFLYFHEEAGQLDSFAMANRLSYFLWNRIPDEELLQLATQGRLSDPQVVRRQVRRMLRHPYGQAFVSDFAAQWLDLSEIDFTTPDRRLFPGFDVIVQHSMLAETETFLQEMLDKNQSVTRLIDADETWLNERLARYYGIDGVAGDQLRKTQLLPEHHRGGVLTHGAVLKVTANGTTTSPVIRGVWVSERLLGVDIPPPPANVPAIEPDIRGATTIRDMLAKHKSDEACASCHRAIDPPGFALENFDPAGRWRDRYVSVEGRRTRPGPAVDPSFELPSGEAFGSLQEFQTLICQDPQKLATNVAEKLITYGTGAPITFADREDVAHIAKRTAEDGFGLRSLIEEVALSPLFRSK